jgi:trehalose/maltose transport system substrate-binding protein
MRRRVIASVIAAIAVGVLAAGCGGGGGKGPAQLNFYVFPEPSGSFEKAAQDCSKASNGAYDITVNTLPSDADGQRQQLVRRLSAKDDSIDLIGMDVIWTAEFAEAGWIVPWTGQNQQAASKGVIPALLASAQYKGQTWVKPFTTNTQLLFYHKDVVKGPPPTTWDQMIQEAQKIGGSKGKIVVQGRRYEGLVVWFNSLVASAGGTIVDNGKVTLGPPGQRAAQIMKRLATSKAADPSLSAEKEDQARIAFESGSAAFEINYPFIYPSAKTGAPKIFKELAWKPYPAVEAGKPAKAPIGGINWGVGAYTKHPAQAFAAAKGGLPPTLSKIYDDPAFKKSYPFSDLIRSQVNSGAVRPQTPAYSDVSLAIAKTVSPPSKINLNGFVDNLRGKLKDALESKGLF